MRQSLGHSVGIVVARAATLVGRARAEALLPDLMSTFDRLVGLGIEADPGCFAKKAVLDALDELEIRDWEPFLVGARCRQLEKALGGPVDTAVGVRARAAAGLVRTSYDDVLLVLGELLGDPEAAVRRAAATAVGYRGLRDGAALLVMKMRLGDEDPMVLLECASELARIAPDYALGVLKPMLWSRDATAREIAAVALGQTRSEAALDLLFDYLERGGGLADRQCAIGAIGVHRSERARAKLLALCADGTRDDALAAVEALSAHRYEATLVSALRAAVAGRRDRAVAARLDELLG